MTTSDIREKYLQFFEKRGHKIVPSASLVPENDPTTLFTGSGMQPMVPYLLGQAHPLGKRLTDSQKCFRAEDIDEVGDNRHTTFFEMLGNWSLGDYFKKEQLRWFFEFLTDAKEGLGLDPEKFYVSVFAGDRENNLPADEESIEIWQELFREKGVDAKFVEIGTEERGGEVGMQGGRIFSYGGKNWWSRAGAPTNMPVGEPGGPDSEVFYDFGTEHDTAYGEHCHPNCDCGRFLEIGNSVFMQYVKKGEAEFGKLPKENVDFGGGLERLSAVSAGTSDVFEIDVLKKIITALEGFSGKSYSDSEYTHSFRVIADHIRGVIFMIGDGVLPSNTEQGYFVRRLIRRSVRHMDVLGVKDGSIADVVPTVIDSYAEAYPELEEKSEEIESAVRDEEAKFRKTLEKGLRQFEKVRPAFYDEPGMTYDEQTPGKEKQVMSGKVAFDLHQTYGFPIELVLEEAEKRNIWVNLKEFEKEKEKHQEVSRKGAEQKFKGGLSDQSEMSVKYHTATHLLNAALRSVLGEHVSQRGSNITPERLRFDFSHDAKLTDEEKQAVEKFVNDSIEAALPVTCTEMTLEEARAQNAVGVFGEKYGDTVKVYRIGDGAEQASLEICGGPHVENTSELGHFKIKKEEASSAGVRRIKAVLE